MSRFLLGFIIGFFVVLVAMSLIDSRPAKAFVDDESQWYAVTTVMATPGHFGSLIADKPFKAKDECEAWVKTKEYADNVAETIGDLAAKFPKIKVVDTTCVQPPANSEGNPA